MRITLLCALTITVILPHPAQAQGLRVYAEANRFEARTEARETCQPLVILFYDSALARFSGGQKISPEKRIRKFFSWQAKRRDKTLAKAVVVLLPIEDWRGPANDLGVTTNEGWASVSPFELKQITSASSFGYLEFR